MKTIADLGVLNDKTIIVRSDLNVPMQALEITDKGRILAAVPTIRLLSDAGAKVIVISHLGRPGGKNVAELSLSPVARVLEEELQRKVSFASDTVGPEAGIARASMQAGEVLLLENLRFHAAETSKDETERFEFAKQLAAGADGFVSDGFGVVHRQQASVTELAQVIPAAAGLLVSQESEVLEGITKNPSRPTVVILGGSKVSDKLGVIDHLLERVDSILIGGGMMFTFLASQGLSVASSLCEKDMIPLVKSYLERAEKLGVEIVLPSDAVVAKTFASDSAHETVKVDQIANTVFGESAIGLDIGPETVKTFATYIKDAQTIFWNGPMGVFEFEAFADGTRGVADALSKTKAFTVVGGGDSASAVRALGFEDKQFNHISTGGGASLEFLEGKVLPGLEVLSK